MNTQVLLTRPSGDTQLAEDVTVLCDHHLGRLKQPIVLGKTEDSCHYCDKLWYQQLTKLQVDNVDWLCLIGGSSLVYIAGPMTGLPNYNKSAFWMMEHVLKTTGCTILSPAHYTDEHPYEWYMRKGLEMALQANTLVMLPGWDKSNGACLEYLVANTVGNQIYYAK